MPLYKLPDGTLKFVPQNIQGEELRSVLRQSQAPPIPEPPLEPEEHGWGDAVKSAGLDMIGSFGDMTSGLGSLASAGFGVDAVGQKLSDWGKTASDFYQEKREPYVDPNINFEKLIQGDSDDSLMSRLSDTARGALQESGPTLGFLSTMAIPGAALGRAGSVINAARAAGTIGRATGAATKIPGSVQKMVQAADWIAARNPIIRKAIESAPFVIPARLAEGMAEGGGVYSEALAAGMSKDDAHAASVRTTLGNMPLAVIDMAQFSAFTNALPKEAQRHLLSIGRSYITKIPLKLGMFIGAAVAEGQEETVQEEIKSWAMERGFDPKVVYNPVYARGKHPESWNLGTLTGGIIGGANIAVDRAIDLGMDKMTPDEQLKILRDTEETAPGSIASTILKGTTPEGQEAAQGPSGANAGQLKFTKEEISSLVNEGLTALGGRRALGDKSKFSDLSVEQLESVKSELATLKQGAAGEDAGKRTALIDDVTRRIDGVIAKKTPAATSKASIQPGDVQTENRINPDFTVTRTPMETERKSLQEIYPELFTLASAEAPDIAETVSNPLPSDNMLMRMDIRELASLAHQGVMAGEIESPATKALRQRWDEFYDAKGIKPDAIPALARNPDIHQQERDITDTFEEEEVPFEVPATARERMMNVQPENVDKTSIVGALAQTEGVAEDIQYEEVKHWEESPVDPKHIKKEIGTLLTDVRPTKTGFVGKNKNGRLLNVVVEKELLPTQSELNAHGIKDITEYRKRILSGQIDPMDGRFTAGTSSDTIHLSRGAVNEFRNMVVGRANKGTFLHETFHMLWEYALTPGQRTALVKKHQAAAAAELKMPTGTTYGKLLKSDAAQAAQLLATIEEFAANEFAGDTSKNGKNAAHKQMREFLQGMSDVLSAVPVSDEDNTKASIKTDARMAETFIREFPSTVVSSLNRTRSVKAGQKYVEPQNPASIPRKVELRKPRSEDPTIEEKPNMQRIKSLMEDFSLGEGDFSSVKPSRYAKGKNFNHEKIIKEMRAALKHHRGREEFFAKKGTEYKNQTYNALKDFFSLYDSTMERLADREPSDIAAEGRVVIDDESSYENAPMLADNMSGLANAEEAEAEKRDKEKDEATFKPDEDEQATGRVIRFPFLKKVAKENKDFKPIFIKTAQNYGLKVDKTGIYRLRLLSIPIQKDGKEVKWAREKVGKLTEDASGVRLIPEKVFVKEKRVTGETFSARWEYGDKNYRQQSKSLSRLEIEALKKYNGEGYEPVPAAPVAKPVEETRIPPRKTIEGTKAEPKKITKAQQLAKMWSIARFGHDAAVKKMLGTEEETNYFVKSRYFGGITLPVPGKYGGTSIRFATRGGFKAAGLDPDVYVFRSNDGYREVPIGKINQEGEYIQTADDGELTPAEKRVIHAFSAIDPAVASQAFYEVEEGIDPENTIVSLPDYAWLSLTEAGEVLNTKHMRRIAEEYKSENYGEDLSSDYREIINAIYEDVADGAPAEDLGIESELASKASINLRPKSSVTLDVGSKQFYYEGMKQILGMGRAWEEITGDMQDKAREKGNAFAEEYMKQNRNLPAAKELDVSWRKFVTNLVAEARGVLTDYRTWLPATPVDAVIAANAKAQAERDIEMLSTHVEMTEQEKRDYTKLRGRILYFRSGGQVKSKGSIRLNRINGDPVGILSDWYKGRDIREGALMAEIRTLNDDLLAASEEFLSDKNIAAEMKKLGARSTQTHGLWSKFKQAIGRPGTPSHTTAVQDIASAMSLYLDRRLTGKGYKDKQFYEALMEDPRKAYLWELSQMISKSQGLRDVARQIEISYELASEEAINSGIIFHALDTYSRRIYIDKAGKPISDPKAMFTGRAFKREIPSIMAAWARGYDLAQYNAVNNLQSYKSEMNAQLETRRLIERGLIQRIAVTSVNTAPTIFSIHKPIGQFKDDYAEIEAPGFYHMVPRETVQGDLTDKVGYRILQDSAYYRKYHVGSKSFYLFTDATDYATETGIPIKTMTEIWDKKKLYAKKDVAKKINNELAPGFEGKLIDTLLRINAFVKSTILLTSFFHHQAYLRSFILGSHGGPLAKYAFRYDPATGKRVQDIAKGNFIEAYRNGIELVKHMDNELMLLIENGLTIGDQNEWDEIIASDLDKAARAINRKFKGAGNFAEKLIELRNRQSSFLFKRFGGGLKAQTGLIEFQRNLAIYKNSGMTPAEIAKLTADMVNEDFGGLRFGRYGVNRKSQQILRLAFLAPDWTSSNALTSYKLFKAAGADQLGIKTDYINNKVVRDIYARFWAGVAAKGVALTITANVAMALLGIATSDEDEPIVEKLRQAFMDDWTKFHFLDADITPIYNLIMGDAGDGRRRWFSVLGHFKDPLKWVANPPKSARGKASPLVRWFLEFFSGSDWKDDPFTTIDELFGMDDNGYYKQDGPGHRAGDPKGGKHAWKLTKRFADYGDQGGPLRLSQVPSFVLAQAVGSLPVQAQELLYGISGERDIFDVLARSVGMHHAAAKSDSFGMLSKEAVREGMELKSRAISNNSAYKRELKKNPHIMVAYNKAEATRKIIRKYKELIIRAESNDKMSDREKSNKIKKYEDLIRQREKAFVDFYQALKGRR